MLFGSHPDFMKGHSIKGADPTVIITEKCYLMNPTISEAQSRLAIDYRFIE